MVPSGAVEHALLLQEYCKKIIERGASISCGCTIAHTPIRRLSTLQWKGAWRRHVLSKTLAKISLLSALRQLRMKVSLETRCEVDTCRLDRRKHFLISSSCSPRASGSRKKSRGGGRRGRMDRSYEPVFEASGIYRYMCQSIY